MTVYIDISFEKLGLTGNLVMFNFKKFKYDLLNISTQYLKHTPILRTMIIRVLDMDPDLILIEQGEMDGRTLQAALIPEEETSTSATQQDTPKNSQSDRVLNIDRSRKPKKSAKKQVHEAKDAWRNEGNPN